MKKVALITGVDQGIGLADSDSFTPVVDMIEEQYGKLDVLINNAAILIDMGKHPSDLTENEFRQVLEVKYIGPFLLTQRLVSLLKKSEAGRIVNMASQVAQLAQLSDMDSPLREDIYAAYQSSKVGVNAMTVLYAKELEPCGIKVNACCPGWVDSGMNVDELPVYTDEDGNETRPKTAEEGADTPVWLATLPADGPTGGFFTDRTRIDW